MNSEFLSHGGPTRPGHPECTGPAKIGPIRCTRSTRLLDVQPPVCVFRVHDAKNLPENLCNAIAVMDVMDVHKSATPLHKNCALFTNSRCPQALFLVHSVSHRRRHFLHLVSATDAQTARRLRGTACRGRGLQQPQRRYHTRRGARQRSRHNPANLSSARRPNKVGQTSAEKALRAALCAHTGAGGARGPWPPRYLICRCTKITPGRAWPFCRHRHPRGLEAGAWRWRHRWRCHCRRRRSRRRGPSRAPRRLGSPGR